MLRKGVRTKPVAQGSLSRPSSLSSHAPCNINLSDRQKVAIMVRKDPPFACSAARLFRENVALAGLCRQSNVEKGRGSSVAGRSSAPARQSARFWLARARRALHTATAMILLAALLALHVQSPSQPVDGWAVPAAANGLPTPLAMSKRPTGGKGMAGAATGMRTTSLPPVGRLLIALGAGTPLATGAGKAQPSTGCDGL